ncbi:MAG: efflux RND transporter permease subunit, partial [Flavobacteriaceae bacterium]|nr:efflux RND transporter permease subunit [Flavobacteriaceae bacterium]
MSVKEGIAGKIAQAFLESKLSLLLMLVFLAVGIYSTFLIPREEEPQIDVPMADIFVHYPGASPTEVESRVSQPLEKILSNIPGVEHIYSTSMSEQSMLIVQFYVGEDVERSLVKLYDQLYKNLDLMPKGVSMPLVKSRSIDDVPVLGLTLWSENYDDFALRKMTIELQREIEKTKDVSTTKIIGGRSRQLKIIPDASKMLSAKVDLSTIARSVRSANQQELSGTSISSDREFVISSGTFISSAEELEQLVIGSDNGQPIYLKQVARIEIGPEAARSYTGFSYGAAHELQPRFSEEYPAITLSIAKRKGADAMQLADKILAKTEQLQQHLIPNDVKVEVTRNYGATASQKVSELLMHLIVAIIAVTIVVMLAMGWRGGLVVFLSVPVTFALTLLSYYLLDYTLNRITLFALVFVTGIVVDDSIIIAENMH